MGESMARGKADQNNAILEYALSHLERERDEIQTKIDHILSQLGGRPSAAPKTTVSESVAPTNGPRKKRVLSEGARKRIAAAQKRRWAEHRKAKAETE
jgi:hypothetical protein